MSPRARRRLPSWAAGLIALALIGIGTAHAFNRTFIRAEAPWSDPYEVSAVFASAQNIGETAPVRIAGVDVGEVTEVRLLSADAPELSVGFGPGESDGAPAARVTMRIAEEGRPIHQDATLSLRPRLLFGGNLFVDLRPGSPSAPEAPKGFVYPLGQTAVSVQLDEVFTTLQGDVRRQLQALLGELGAALAAHGGAEGLRELYRSAPGAFRPSARVSEAFLGDEPHDLSGLVAHLDRVFRGLGRNEEQLKGVVTKLRVFGGALAAENEALRRAFSELPRTLKVGEPALGELERSLPPLRALAREALPGTRAAAPALRAGVPFMRQLRGLASERELRGLVADLRPAMPRLAGLTASTTELFEQVRPLSSCLNGVVVPWQNDTVSADPLYPHPAVGEVYKEGAYGLVGLAGESRSGDANGQYIRYTSATGPNVVVLPPQAGRPEELVGLTPFPILGSMPAISSSAKTPFRPDVPCETQEPPSLDAGGIGPAPRQSRLRMVPASELEGPIGEAARRLEEIVLDPFARASARVERGGEVRVEALRERVDERYASFLRSGFRPYARAIRQLGGRGG